MSNTQTMLRPEKTWMQLPVVCSILGCAIAGAYYASSLMSVVQSAVDDVGVIKQDIRIVVEKVGESSASIREMRALYAGLNERYKSLETRLQHLENK